MKQPPRDSIALTPSAAWGYAHPVTGVPVIGFSSSKQSGGQPPFPYGSRHFFRPWSGVAPMGGTGRGALQAAMPQDSPVPGCRSANPFGSAHPFSRGLAGNRPQTRSLTMDTHTSGASAPMQAAKPAVFQFQSTEVRTVDRDGQVWFVAGDVAKALNYNETKDMTRFLDEDEKGAHIVPTLGGDQSVTILSESGLYHALLKSRKPQARPFRRWVTSEVLPAIRRGGSYSGTAPQIPNLTQQSRFLLTVYEEGHPQITPLPDNACILSATNKVSMTTLMRIGLDRLARMAERGRNAPLRATPVDKEIKT